MATSHSPEVRNDIADLVTSLLDGGVLLFLTAQGRVVVAIDLPDPAFSSAGGMTNGVAEANPMVRGVSEEGGQISKMQLRDRLGALVVAASVSLPGRGGDIEMDAVLIQPGQSVEMEWMKYTASP